MRLRLASSDRALPPVLLLSLALAACGDPVSTEDSGSPRDAQPIDAEGRMDGGADGGDDGGAEIDAAPVPCDSPGSSDSVPCGRCGTVARFCTSEGIWAYGACEGEGVCAPGTSRDAACGLCGTVTERCSDACGWAEEGDCTSEGDCEPGTRGRDGEGCPAGQTRELLCGDACLYEPAGACEIDSCPTPGALERLPCGNCGTRERFCSSDGVWTYGACEDEGVCAPGTLDRVDCGNCGSQSARCTTACAWEATGACEAEGACAPGSTSSTAEGCPAGQTRPLTCEASCSFSMGACAVNDPCAIASAANATVGCEFWPVVTPNSALQAGFNFGVLVVNTQPLAATVTVYRGATVVATRTIAPGSSAEIVLPRIAALDFSTSAIHSVRVAGGAYRLVSSGPVAVTQLFALEAELGAERAYTIDGSLLLPTHALGTSVRVVSQPSRMVRRDDPFFPPAEYLGASGFVTVVAVEAGTITLNASAHVAASADGVTIGAIAAGSSASFSLARGDVITFASAQVNECPVGSPVDGDTTYCLQGPTYDLTGSRITSTGRVAVVGGHDCAFVPYDRWACDHLESSLLPDSRLGRRYLVARTIPFTDEPNHVRIMSNTAGNVVTFTPSSVSASFTLGAGEYREIAVRSDVLVEGTGPLSVTQLLVGELFDGMASTGGGGDPSMAMLLPISAFTTSIGFHSPSGFTGHVNVIAPTGATATVDGTAVSGWRAVTGTGMRTARIPVSAGIHRIEGSAPLGGVSYGFASYVSYLAPLGGEL